VARLVHELLWLWEPETSDEAGVDEVAGHDLAVRVHRQVVEAEFGGESGAAGLRGEAWERALAAWASVLGSHDFWDHAKRRVADIGDPRLTTGTVRRLRERLPRHIVSVTAELALRAARAEPPPEEEMVRRLGAPLTGAPRPPAPPEPKSTAQHFVALLLASPFAEEVVADALREAVRPSERTIRAAVETARVTVNATEDEGGAAGEELVARTTEPLRVVRTLLGRQGTLTAALSQEVAVQLNYCGVAHYNATSTTRTALALLHRAAELAQVRRTQELLADNIDLIGRSATAVPTGPSADLPPFLQKLALAGKVERVAAYLRAMAAVQTDARVRTRLRAQATDRRSVAAPVHEEPFLGSLLGCGVRPHLSAGPDAEGTLWMTYTLTLLYLPVLPLAMYVTDNRGVHSRVPLSTRARWWRRALFTALLIVFVAVVAGLPTAAGFAGVWLVGQLYFRAQLRRSRVGKWSYEARKW
jgi:hypothetical protein